MARPEHEAMNALFGKGLSPVMEESCRMPIEGNEGSYGGVPIFLTGVASGRFTPNIACYSLVKPDREVEPINPDKQTVYLAVLVIGTQFSEFCTMTVLRSDGAYDRVGRMFFELADKVTFFVNCA